MTKVILSVVGLIFLFILAGSILPDVVDDTVADPYSENYNVTTAANETTTVETLTYDHYYGDLTDLAATSTDGDDDPVVMAYDEDARDVTVAGLQAATSRILTIAYYKEENTEFTGFNAFVKLSPLLFILGGIVACIWGLYSSFHKGG